MGSQDAIGAGEHAVLRLCTDPQTRSIWKLRRTGMAAFTTFVFVRKGEALIFPQQQPD